MLFNKQAPTPKKPLEFIHSIELRAWMRNRNNKAVRMVWEILSPVMRQRYGPRSVHNEVFALGFIAGRRSRQSEVESLAPLVTETMDRLVNEMLDTLEARASGRVEV
jgi:hypothetical protein